MDDEIVACETPISELRAGALAHYEKLVTEAHEWYSVVPRAINAYYDALEAKERAAPVPALGGDPSPQVDGPLPALDGEAEATFLIYLAESLEQYGHGMGSALFGDDARADAARLRTLAAALRSGGTPDTTTEEPTK